MPRGNGKSTLAGYLATRILTPDDSLFVRGSESVLTAASLEQARIVFRFAREALDPTGGYRFLDSHTRIGIVHKATNTRLRAIGSNGKTAMGLVGCPWAICDEPGAWEIRGGELVWDALETAQGKPGSRLAHSGNRDARADGVRAGPLVVRLGRGRLDAVEVRPSSYKAIPNGGISGTRFDAVIRSSRYRPNSAESCSSSATRRAAITRLKARFLSYRLNAPAGDETTMLLTIDELAAYARPRGRGARGSAVRRRRPGRRSRVVGGVRGVAGRSRRGRRGRARHSGPARSGAARPRAVRHVRAAACRGLAARRRGPSRADGRAARRRDPRTVGRAARDRVRFLPDRRAARHAAEMLDSRPPDETPQRTRPPMFGRSGGWRRMGR